MSKTQIKNFLADRRTMFGLWMLLGIISALTKLTRHNNFDIFRYVFYNTWNQTSLYAENTRGTLGHQPLRTFLLSDYCALCCHPDMVRTDTLEHLSGSLSVLGNSKAYESKDTGFIIPTISSSTDCIFLCTRTAHCTLYAAVQHSHCSNHTAVILLCRERT